MQIAMLGTRGVPAAYGGFETAVEEIGRRLVARGHSVRVYCRHGDSAVTTYLGMSLVHLPAVRRRSLDTLSHSAMSVAHLLWHPVDAAFVFNVANSPIVPLLLLRSIPYAINVDGVEWKRSKWGSVAKNYYKLTERLAVRSGRPLIADSQGIADYYSDRFNRSTEVIAYGAPPRLALPSDSLERCGLKRGNYLLVVARLERENNVHLIINGFRQSRSALPLIIVGDAPYADAYRQELQELAGDADVRFIGRVDDQSSLDQLYFHAAAYLHGHSVGGTNPSLLRALGCGTRSIVHRNTFNVDVAGSAALTFDCSKDVSAAIQRVEKVGPNNDRDAIRQRVTELYNWDSITDSYERLAQSMTGVKA